MPRLLTGLTLLGLLSVLPSSSPACSFCPTPLTRESLGQEVDRAHLIIYAYAANPKLNLQEGAAPGSGTTDFHIERVVKDHPLLGDKKVLTLERYVPVLDPKDPPRFLIFCEVAKGKFDAYLGRTVKSQAVIGYLEGAKAERAKGRPAALAYYARYLGHTDDLVAEDAFLEFARSKDDEVGQVAKQLDPKIFRALLQKPGLDADRISLFSFLLGSCGGPQDADYLRKRAAGAQNEDVRALDGMLGGILALQPKEGWRLVEEILRDKDANFLKRFSAMRAVRFYMGWKPAETKEAMLSAYKLVLPDGESADLAIEDLRRWKTWDLTPLVLAQYGKATHDAPIVRRSIIRYALSCPLPEARRFVEQVEAKDAELVRELREFLEFEKQN